MKRAEFEAALPATFANAPGCPWRYVGEEFGERVYYLRVQPQGIVYIKVRVDGKVIRAWLIDQNGELLSYNIVQQSEPKQMLAMLHRLAELSGYLKPCIKCGRMMRIGQSEKKDAKRGQYFLSCLKACDQLEWIQE